MILLLCVNNDSPQGRSSIDNITSLKVFCRRWETQLRDNEVVIRCILTLSTQLSQENRSIT
jgi:hypothetical protein